MADELPDGDNPESFDAPPPFFSQNFGENPDDSHVMVQVEVEAVYVREDSATRDHFVVLKDRSRRLSIMIDPCNALAISRPLEGSVPDRPLTHDLMKTVFDKLDVTVDKVLIDDLWSTTYYAKIVLKSGQNEMEIDSRPSDAIAIATRCNAPIYVSETILDNAPED